MASKPTQRAIMDLKKMGFTVAIVERWNSFVKRRQDLLGCIDILALRPGVGIIGIQATDGTSHSKRVEKSIAEPRLRAWLESGGRFEVWSYAKRGARGARKIYQLRRQEITLDDLPAEPAVDEPRTEGASLFNERSAVA